MRIAIAGAGAMGAMFGGYLTRGGHDVTLVDIDANHVNAIVKHGLILRTVGGQIDTIPMKATSDPIRELGPVEAVIVLCKGWANEVVARSIQHAVEPETVIATVQNGLGNDRSLASVLGAGRVMPGTTTAGAHRSAPGLIDVSPITSSGASITQLGMPRDSQTIPPKAQNLADAMTASGLPCTILADADVVLWTKLALAATAGPLTAALGATVETMMASPTAVVVLRCMFDEILAVSESLAIRLDAEELWEHAMSTYTKVGPHMTSMAADFASGRPSEIDSFCIEISRLGAENAVPTPTHDTIGRLLVAREEQGGLR